MENKTIEVGKHYLCKKMGSDVYSQVVVDFYVLKESEHYFKVKNLMNGKVSWEKKDKFSTTTIYAPEWFLILQCFGVYKDVNINYEL